MSVLKKLNKSVFLGEIVLKYVMLHFSNASFRLCGKHTFLYLAGFLSFKFSVIHL